MGNRYPPPELLEKYLSGRCSPDEARQVEDWYDSFETRPDLESHYSYTQNEAYRNQILQRIYQRIHDSDAGKKRWSIWGMKGLWYLGGMVAAVITLTLVIWQFYNQAAPARAALAVRVLPEWADLENNSKRILRHELTDGSVVWLSPATKLQYPSRFASSVRTVKLEGEAFFEVHRDTTRPFIIQTGKLKTEVLGTTFNIRAYRNSPDFEVSVVTGKVAVSVANQKKVLLTARQQAVFNSKAESLAKTSLHRSARPKLWEPATIAFEWASLREVADALEQTFNVRIAFRNQSLKRCMLRADFTNMRLPVILNLLCKTTETSYTLDGQEIEFDGLGCP